MIESNKTSENIIRKALIINQVGVWQWDKKNNFWIDPEWLKSFGYSEDEIDSTLNFLFTILKPTDALAFKSISEKYFKHEIAQIDCNLSLRTKGNKDFYVYATGRYSSNSKETIHGFFFPSTKTMYYKETIENSYTHSIKQEKELLDSIMKNSSTAITLLLPDGKIAYANKSAETVLGIKLSDITSRTYDSPNWKFSAIDGSAWLDEDQPFVRVLTSGESVTDIRHAIEDKEGNKKYLSINGSPIKNENNEITALTFLVTDITDNILKEKEITESEFKYRTIVEQTMSMVYELDLQTGKIQWAGAIEELTGFTVDYLNKNNYDFWSSSIHPDDRDRVLQEMDFCMKTKKRFISEYRFLTKTGEYKFFEDSGVFIYSDSDEPKKMLGAMIDRTERKKNEECLKIAQERLRLALEAAKMGTWIWNIKENTIEWSEQTFILYDLDPDNFKLNLESYFNFIHPDYLEYFKKTVLGLLEPTQSQDEFTVIHKIITSKGVEKWVEGHGKLIRDDEGIPEQMIGTVTDITDRKWQEEEIRISEERFQAFYHFTNEAIIVTEKGTRKIVDVNTAFLSLFGYHENSWLGLRINDLVSKDSIKSIRNLYDFNKVYSKLEMHGIRKDGTIFPILVSTSDYKSQDNEYIAYTVIDISSLKEIESLKMINKEIQLKNQLIEKQKIELESTINNLKKTQAQLIQSEKMAAIGQLVAGIAHEVNNPVAAIKASHQNITEWYDSYMNFYPQIYKDFLGLNEEDKQSLFHLIERLSNQGEFLSSKQAKNAKRNIYNFLTHSNLSDEEAESLTETLIEIGISEINESDLRLIRMLDIKKISEFILIENIFRRNIKTIKYAVDRVTKIVYALKNFTHIDNSSEKRPINLSQSIDIVLTIYQNQIKKGIQVIKDIKEDITIKGFPDDVLHIWTNLIYNAIQAMNYNGTIHIRVFREDLNAIIEIEDNGSGIPEEIKGKIFDPFFTTKLPGEGSGIGLDIVNKIIEKHNGLISFQSQPGQTIFQVKLPID